MRINGYRCDACCKEHLLAGNAVIQYFGDGVPRDWFMVCRGNPKCINEPTEIFCSTKCLLDYAEKIHWAKRNGEEVRDATSE